MDEVAGLLLAGAVCEFPVCLHDASCHLSDTGARGGASPARFSRRGILRMERAFLNLEAFDQLTCLVITLGAEAADLRGRQLGGVYGTAGTISGDH